MENKIFIAVLVAFSLLFLSGLSIAGTSPDVKDGQSNADPDIKDEQSNTYPGRYEDKEKDWDSCEGPHYEDGMCYPYDCSNPCGCGHTFDEDSSSINRKFYEGLSYTGHCEDLPTGSTCIKFSDGYIWAVHDYRIDCHPHIVGTSNTKCIEMFRCYYGNYYHILGTSLIMSVENPEKISINAPLSCVNGKCTVA